MSSDSDEDIGLRLQKMTKRYQGDKIESTALLNDSNEIDEIFEKPPQNDRESSPLDLDDLPGPPVVQAPVELPEVVLNKRPKRVTRSSARKRNADETFTEELPLSSRRKSKKTAVTEKSTIDDACETTNISNSTATTVKGRGRGRGRGRSKNSQTNTRNSNSGTSNNTNIAIGTSGTANTSSSCIANANMSSTSTRGHALNTSSRSRGRGSRSNRRNRRSWVWLQTSPARGSRRNPWGLAQLMAEMTNASTYRGHTYVIGDAEDVADASRGQALFSNQKPTEVVDVEENEDNNDSLDDNEELSVKVHWQSYKYEIFKIRRYQKFTQIFDYFSEKENVSYDKLLFMYNDKIIKPSDTPDSINYNIAKKIEGGILENSVAPIMSVEDDIKDGLKIKFQCQHLKKPFEIVISPDDKFSVAMTKCAEHLEKPLSVLRFEFDGDIISGKSTARELELEGGECIDVKVAS